MNKPILVTIVRDPSGKLLKPLQSVDLGQFYSQVYANVTRDTSEALRDELAICDGEVVVTNPTSLSNSRRTVLARAQIKTGPDAYYHYCDLDRLLFWAINHPIELARVTRARQPFVTLGRSPVAFASHPLLQRKTEGVVNSAFYLATGKKWDVLAASRLISRQMLDLILIKSKADGPGVDVEWPLMAWGYGNYMEVDGLGYESDFFGIRRNSRDEAWLRWRNMVDLLSVFWGFAR